MRRESQRKLNTHSRGSLSLQGGRKVDGGCRSLSRPARGSCSFPSKGNLWKLEPSSPASNVFDFAQGLGLTCVPECNFRHLLQRGNLEPMIGSCARTNCVDIRFRHLRNCMGKTISTFAVCLGMTTSPCVDMRVTGISPNKILYVALVESPVKPGAACVVTSGM